MAQLPQGQPQYPSRWGAQPYYQQQNARPARGDIPVPVVIAAGIVVWVLIIGAVVAYAAMAPCSFLKLTTGEESFAKMQDKSNTDPPCEFENGGFSCQGACTARPASKCRVWKFDENPGCMSFIIEATTK